MEASTEVNTATGGGSPAKQPSRGRFTLSLRVLLLLVLGSGLWLGWRANRARAQRRAVLQVDKYNGHVEFDDGSKSWQTVPKGSHGALGWLRRTLGDDYFREVKGVVYVDQPVSDATLVPLDALAGIEELRFTYLPAHGRASVEPPRDLARLTGDGLSRLKGLTRLRRLEIERSMMCDPLPGHLDLRHLSRATQLEELNFSNTGVTDEDLPPLDGFPRLRVLSLWCNPITGTSLRPLRGSRSLEELQIYACPISDDGIASIGAIKSLKYLYFNQTAIDDEGLSRLAGLTALTRLSLDNTKSEITDAGILHLAKMTRLEWLDLTHAKITDRGLVALAGMKDLKRLCLGWTQVDDAGLRIIAGMPRLEVLELHQTKVTDAGLRQLRGLKQLGELSLTGTQVTQEAVDALMKEIPSLAKARR